MTSRLQIAGLALRDALREPVQTFCAVLLVASVLAPLMTLNAAKIGVMDTLIGELNADPGARILSARRDNPISTDDLAKIRAMPEVAFAIGEPGFLSSRAEMRAPDGPIWIDLDLGASDPGDPLLPDGLALGPAEVALSPPAARRMSVGDRAPTAGDRIDLRVMPENGRQRPLFVALTVTAILPEGWLPGAKALAPADLLDDLAAFRAGYAIPARGIDEGRPLSERTPSIVRLRVHADDIRSVEALQARLETMLGTRLSSRAEEIALRLALGRNLDLALGVIGAAAAVGLACALGALLWSNVVRKRRVLATLSLMGAAPGALIGFPMAQAVLYAAFGWVAAVALSALGAIGLELAFADALGAGERIAPLLPIENVLVGALALLISLAAAAAGAVRVMRIDPALVIRET